MHIPRRIPTNLAQYKPAFARRIVRKGTHFRCYTGTPTQRPYTFHIGASWAGKPEDPVIAASKVPFPSDTLVGSWRDKMLSRPKHVRSKDAGEDFFFVQEVRHSRCAMHIPQENRALSPSRVPRFFLPIRCGMDQ